MPETFFGWVGFIIRQYGSLFVSGTVTTLIVALTGTVLGFGIGLLVAIARTTVPGDNAGPLKRGLIRASHALLGAYIEVFRGTPMIVQAMVIYYGAMQYLGLKMPNLAAAVLIVSVNTGAYMAEIIRGGIISIALGQTEAAHSIGMTHWQTMTSVGLPQAIRNIMPSIGNEFIVNITDSSVLKRHLWSRSCSSSPKSAAGTYFRYFEVFFITALIYLALTYSITRLLMVDRAQDGRPENYNILGSQTDSHSVIKVERGAPR
jgi:putative lysine transport system permease protein